MQLQDIQYLTENIWASQSVLSDCDDLNDLVMVRWDKSSEWSPWNCILLTKDEAAAHLKLKSVVEVRKASCDSELMGPIRGVCSMYVCMYDLLFHLVKNQESQVNSNNTQEWCVCVRDGC